MSELEPKGELRLLDPSDSRLAQASEAVVLDEIMSDEVQGIIDTLLQVAGGERDVGSGKAYMVGLAAPQVGIMKRIIVIDTQIRHGNKPKSNSDVPPLAALINPEIIMHSDDMYDFREGCYSFHVKTGVYGVVPRYTKIRVRAYDRNGRQLNFEAGDYTARIIQHETDHLDGIRYNQRMPAGRPLDFVSPEHLKSYIDGGWQNWPTHISDKELGQ